MPTIWKTIWRFLKKFKIELSHDPVVSHFQVYIHPKKIKPGSGRAISSLMFIAASFTIPQVMFHCVSLSWPPQQNNIDWMVQSTETYSITVLEARSPRSRC
jgi:hypothetical protein